MKIHQLLGKLDINIVLTNEEHEFVNKHEHYVPMAELYDRDYVVAQNLVRKGVYALSKDSTNLIRKTDADSK